jgi:hypothetical protein
MSGPTRINPSSTTPWDEAAVASVDLIGPRGETATATELGQLQHLVNARGYSIVTGTYADAVALLSGYASQGASPRVRRFSALPAPPIASNGTGVHSAGAAGTATTGYSARNPYKAAVACTDIQLVFTIGFFLGAGGAVAETAVGATTPNFKAAIETSDGTIHPVFFKGSRLASVDPNGMIVSDPLGIELAAGDVFYVRSFVPAATGSGVFWMQGASGYGPGITVSGTTGQTSAGDTVDSGGTYSNGAQLAYDSALVCGQPTGAPTPTVAVVGDSITHGTGSLNTSFAWWKYGFNNAFPTIQYAKPGFSPRASPRTTSVASRCSRDAATPSCCSAPTTSAAPSCRCRPT